MYKHIIVVKYRNSKLFYKNNYSAHRNLRKKTYEYRKVKIPDQIFLLTNGVSV